MNIRYPIYEGVYRILTKENNPSFPKVCEKTVFNYVKKIRKRYDIPARV